MKEGLTKIVLVSLMNEMKFLTLKTEVIIHKLRMYQYS